MKSLTKLLMMVVLTAGSALSQTSAVTATITDPDSQTWNNGTYTINFIPAPNSPGPSTWTGGALTTQFTGSLNSSGVLSVSVADNTTVSPPGSLWQFTLCPNSSAPCQNVRTQVTGASPNLSTTLSNGLIAPRFGSGPFAYGYADVEVVTPVNTGTTYFNVTTGVQRIWNGSAWANNTGGGGTGTVTNIATSGPITGGPLTSTGTIGCATCTTNAAPLTSTAIVTGAGLQATQTPSATSTLDSSGNGIFAGSVKANGTGPALVQLEIADPGAPGANTGSLYWSNAYLRMCGYNHNAGPLCFGTWNITTAGGFNVGGSSQINGINTESALAGNTGSTGYMTESAAGVPSWTAATAVTVPLNNVLSPTGAIATIADGNNPLTITSAQTTAGQTAVALNEATAATSTGTPFQVGINTLAGSTATPLQVADSLNGSQTLPAVTINPTWNTSAAPTGALTVAITNTASGSGSKAFNVLIGAAGATNFFNLQTQSGVVATAALNGPNIALGGSQPTITAPGTTPYLNLNVLTKGTINACDVASALTLTTTTSICSWTLENRAVSWGYQCKGVYSTSAAAITMTLGTQFTQTPTVSRHSALIWSAPSVQTYGSATNNGTTGVTTLTGAAVSTGTDIPWEASGQFTSSATSGTFVIYGTASTTSDVTLIGNCLIF